MIFIAPASSTKANHKDTKDTKTEITAEGAEERKGKKMRRFAPQEFSALRASLRSLR
jgi:hypothetical protein